ncbi:MAG TPA: alanine dehydrogenase [Bryobacteraceae bacterium]|nr:alanine dehydrogenase [Bryobacteraceae bacterium]
MNIGVLKETNPEDRRVALTPPAVRQLTERGHMVWVESGAGVGAMFPDDAYLRAGANIAYTGVEVLRRSAVTVRITGPSAAELVNCPEGAAILAFYHMAVAGSAVFQALLDHKVTAIGCEVIQRADGRLPVLAAVSEIAGQMTISLATHLLRSSSGGLGILLGGSPGVPPAHVVILGGGTVGTWAARSAMAAGARVTVLDIDSDRLRHVLEHMPSVATALAEPDSIASTLATADVAIGAVYVAGARTPHIVSKEMVEAMRPGSVIIDVAIDQGGCFETSRPTTLRQPTYLHRGIVHYCVPNLTADMGRSTSIAGAQAVLPYLIRMADEGLEAAITSCPDLTRAVYTYQGCCVHERLAAAWKTEYKPLAEAISSHCTHDTVVAN